MLTIFSPKATASFAPDSALKNFVVGDHELVGCWQGSNGKPSSSMTMWPVVGMVSPSGKFLYGGQTYTPGKHGYLRGRELEVTQKSDTRINFRHIHDPAKNNGVYPFGNTVIVAHEIEGDALTTTLRATNTDAEPMHFGAGLHPAFVWHSDANGDHGESLITLAEPLPEGTVVYRTIDGKVETRNRVEQPFEGGTVLRLRPDDFAKDAYFVVMPDGQRGGSIRLIFSCPHNPFDIEVTFEGWDGFGIWSKTGKDSTFLCIEALAGIALTDLASCDTPDIGKLIGLKKLSPQRKFRASMKVRPVLRQ